MTRSRDVSAVQNNLGVAIPPAAAGKNAVINGGFDIWQRGTSRATTSYPYTADRWIGGRGGGVAGGTVSRQVTGDTTNLPFIQYCARVQRDSGNTSTATSNFGTPIETINSIPFAGKTVTLSFYARRGANFSGANNQIQVFLATGTGTDQNVFNPGYTGLVNAINGENATLTTDWQRFSFTATLNSNITEIAPYFNSTYSGTAGANDYYEITGVQLELGSSATPFSRAGGTIQGELAACQRYFNSMDCSLNGNAFLGTGVFTATTNFRAMVPLAVRLRAQPSVSFSAGSTFLAQDGGNYTGSAVAADQLSVNNVGVNLTVSGATQYRAGILLGANTSGTISISAEL